MANFKDKLKERESTHAYVIGAESYIHAINSESIITSPFSPGSKEDKEWWDGYFDAELLYM